MSQFAQASVDLTPPVGTPTSSHTGAGIEEVVGSLQTVVTLLDGDGPSTCLITSSMGVHAADMSHLLRCTAADALGIPFEHVLLFSSHNHCTPLPQFKARSDGPVQGTLSADNITPLGHELVGLIEHACRSLRSRLQPVTAHWAVGHERRITYNRKGRRADGTTLFMREEDRIRYGRDYTGDIDDDAPVISFINGDGVPVGFITGFTGHPVTAYHPERMMAFGEWPQVAADHLSEHFGGALVGFVQGCCGDVNSKRMLSGDVGISHRFGRYLADTFIKAAERMKPSERSDFDLCLDVGRVPFARLPAIRKLERELEEIDDFIARANAGDDDALDCVGLNFPRALSPAYRAKLAELIRPWTQWALNTQRAGKTADLPRYAEIPMAALRIGDVGIVGMPCEPFLGIGRQIKAASPLPLAVPCGYMNHSYGYVPDAPNCGDREYMSAYYRYTRFWPPYRRPAGDALAACGLRMLKRLARRS